MAKIPNAETNVHMRYRRTWGDGPMHRRSPRDHFSGPVHCRWSHDCSSALPNRFEGQLVVGDVAVDPAARLAITFDGGGSLLVDIVSLFPAKNIARSGGGINPWPFRTDLLQMLKDLHPRQGAAEIPRNVMQQSAAIT